MGGDGVSGVITFELVPTDRPHWPRDDYVERCWLPILGPTAIAIARIVSAELHEVEGEPWAIHWVDLASMVGLSGGTAKNSPVVRSVQRLVNFSHVTGVVLADGCCTVGFLERWRSLSEKQAARLLPAVRDVHDSYYGDAVLS